MRKTPRSRVVIVDGYSTGRELLRELLDREAECLHLQSTPELPAPVANCFDRMPYDGDLGYLGTVPAAIEALATLKPDAVVAGSEWGVTFAERIAAGMALPGNRFETIAARRDKFEMIEAVRRSGLLVAEQAAVATVAEAHAWAKRHAAWPIVVKPMKSAGSDGVTICQDHADIDTAFAQELGRENFMGCVNSRLLLQSFLPGPQFIVNTVSWGGRHYVSDLWSMSVAVTGSRVVPGGIHLCDPTLPRAQALIAYTLQVLSALGIENGAAHTELKWTPQGPALIETGARLMGAAMDEPSYARAGMRTQANVFAEMLASCASGREALFAAGCYGLHRQMSKVLFNFAADGRIRGTAGLSRLRELPSFHAHYRPLGRGDRVWQTGDWLACGGMVYLVHDDLRQISADIKTIRLWEARGELYDVAPCRAAA
ncbi:ATP-grasp domain-containing protein [Bosea caraganae]|nr:ATP-grasp domain-containing protein [Bosea caraganae]